ncbi:MAG: dicarboxylate/amino acid:cation symporter [Alphaproteobacteria bacterium]|nr:dicarboxylate/amino acid:cation symporter [Alphaproteobacteria bacterium]
MFQKDDLFFKILIALPLGIITGLIFYYYIQDGFFRNDLLINGLFTLVGQTFICLMQMIVVPLIFCSLVCGSMSIGNSKTMGKLGLQAFFFFFLTTIVATSLALTSASLLNPGTNLNLDLQAQDITSHVQNKMSIVEILLSFIPKNPISAMANGDILPVIVFALCIGLATAKCEKDESTFKSLMEQLNEIFHVLTTMILKLAPYGTFSLLTITFSNSGLTALFPIIKFVGCVLLTLFIHMFIFYPILLYLLTKLSPKKFFKKFFPAILFAFSTSSSNATIPVSMDTLEKNLGVSKKVSSFTIPLGATINMDGTSIMQGVAVIFIAQIYGMDLTFTDFLTIMAMVTAASIGTAGIPGAGIIMLSIILTSLNLPIEGIALIIGIDRIIDMFRTAVNITGDAIITTIISEKNNAFDIQKYNE